MIRSLSIMLLFLAFLSAPVGATDSISLEQEWESRNVTRNEAKDLVLYALRTMDEAQKDMKVALDAYDLEGLHDYVEYPLLILVSHWPKGNFADKQRMDILPCVWAADDLRCMAIASGSPDGVKNRKIFAGQKKHFEEHYPECRKVASSLGLKPKDWEN